MTAKEMFEAQGYKIVWDKVENGERKIVYQHQFNFIKFVLNENNELLGYTSSNSSYTIYAALHQAITQQMKELGWIE